MKTKLHTFLAAVFIYLCLFSTPLAGNNTSITTKTSSTSTYMASEDRHSDSLILVDLYNNTNGAEWFTKWNLNQSMDTWEGLTLDNGRVAVLDLDGHILSYCGGECGNGAGNNLVGTLPSSIWQLTTLRSLQLAGNRNLQYTLPSEISNLSNLKDFTLGDTKIIGNLPESIGQLTKLTFLNLDGLRLTELPASMNNLVNLDQLVLSYNNLTSLPDLSNLQSLRVLFFYFSNLTGPFPEWMLNLSNLEVLHLNDNNLSGDIDVAWEKLSKLSSLRLDGNNFTGTIPEAIMKLPQLGDIDLSENQFHGQIPIAILDYPRYAIDLKNNQLSGIVPDFTRHQTLNFLEIQNNNFTFSDFITSLKKTQFGIIGNEFGYAPQATVLLEDVYHNLVGTDRTVDLGIDEDVSTNVYTWYKDGQPYKTIAGENKLSFSNMTLADSGTYFCEITNTTAPKLTLRSTNFLINVYEPEEEQEEEEAQEETSSSTIFQDYPWLSEILAPSNCTGAKITTYQSGIYQYLLVETAATGSVLYNADGVLYCTNSPNYDCIAAYNLGNPSTWICEAESEVEEEEMEENMDNGSTNNDAPIFEEYRWLTDLIDVNNCEGVTISTYTTGAYKYLLVETATDSKLYNENGVLYCTNAANYDCVAAYNLSAPSVWTCTNEIVNEEEEPTTTEPAIFENYPWLRNYIMNLGDCEGSLVTVYDVGNYQFLLVETPTLGEYLFLGDGTFYCSSTSTYDCTAAYSLLEEQITTTWACGEQGLIQPPVLELQTRTSLVTTSLTVFPNPASSHFTVQLPVLEDKSIEQALQLVNITGQIVWSSTTSTTTTTIDVQHLSKGIYFLNWSTPLGAQTTRLVIE